MAEYEKYAFSGKSQNCYGLEIVAETARRNGHAVHDYVPNSGRDVLFSLYWPEQIYDFVKWRYSGEQKGRKILVGGNAVTANPSSVLAFDAMAYLGDGELWNGTYESEYVLSGKERKPRKRAISSTIEPLPYEDVQDNRRAFCEMSRGCKNKCLFCQYGWMKPYRESDVSDIRAVLRHSKTKSVRMFAADRFQHSRYDAIRNHMDKLGKCDTGSDVSLRFIRSNPEYLKLTNKVRTGVEGMSERLRYMIGKAYKDEAIVDFCVQVADAGIKSLDFYMIYGLPSETAADIESFESLLMKIDKAMPKGYAIALHWNAFSPNAQTPFQHEAPAFNYPYVKEMERMFSKRGERIKIMHKPKLTSDWTQIRRMLAVRSSMRTRDLVYTFTRNEPKFKRSPRHLFDAYKRIEGVDLMGPWPINKPMPWDGIVEYDRERMMRLRNSAMAKYGT